MPNQIYVLIDHSGGELQQTSLETLAFAQAMARDSGFSLHAILMGDEVRRPAEKLDRYDLKSVLIVEDEKLKEYEPHLHCQALRSLLKQEQPSLLLMGHIYQNIDLAPKLAAATKTGLVTDCIGYRWDDDGFIFTRQMFRNKLNADVRIKSDPPWIVTIQAGAASAEDLAEGNAGTKEIDIDLSDVTPRRKTLEAFEAVKGKVDLSQAEIVVAVGRGIKKAENLKLIEEFAKVLGAEIGASRPVVDNQWLERDRQIGSSGQSVSPRLYIACGISGAIQHIVGMKNSQCIVAINVDPHAPIFNVATYGIVGDLFEIVPALTRKLREAKG